MPAWIILLPIIELGSLSGSAAVPPGYYEIADNTYYVVTGVEARLFDTVSIAFGVENWFIDLPNNWQFAPILDRYHSEVSVERRNFSLTFYHRCDHPVMSEEDPANILGGITKLSIAYNGRWK